ncbi:MAG: addiction module protein [Firmicutes bacterium]|nr:addiction module protein [Bacillota bacterium]
MSTHVPWPPSGFDDLSPDEQVDYVQSLWDRIIASGDRVQIPDWHRVIIRQRLEEEDAEASGLRDWVQLREQIARDLASSKPHS